MLLKEKKKEYDFSEIFIIIFLTINKIESYTYCCFKAVLKSKIAIYFHPYFRDQFLHIHNWFILLLVN